MGITEDRARIVEERRRKLAAAVPQRGFAAWFDRGAWGAMAQDDPAVWSWPKALVTVGAGIVLALIIYATIFESVSFVVGLAVAYGILLIRARSVHNRYVRSQAEEAPDRR